MSLSVALVKADDAGRREIGRGLLLRVVLDHGEDLVQVAMAHHDLARSYEEAGNADLAATHYELAVNGEDELGTLVTGADLRRAELIIRCG